MRGGFVDEGVTCRVALSVHYCSALSLGLLASCSPTTTVVVDEIAAAVTVDVAPAPCASAEQAPSVEPELSQRTQEDALRQDEKAATESSAIPEPHKWMRAAATRRHQRRVGAFFKTGFACPAASSSCDPNATFVVAQHGVVTSVVVAPCGDAATENALVQHAQSLVGKTIPPLPNALSSPPRSVRVTYRCR